MNYDIFRDELGSKYPAYGHALWEPDPGGLYNSVEVGDVGFIREGRFHRLFNALLARGHELQSPRVPEYHKPLKPNDDPPHICTSTLSPNDFRSAGVIIDPSGLGINASEPEPERVTYLCSRKKGAILSLPVPAQGANAVALGDFGKWLIKHIDVWFAFARDLGLGISRMEDIILVTGRHLARSSANVAFSESQVEEQVSFGFTADISGVNVMWQFSREGIRGVSFNPGPSGQDLPQNQCIFVRGFHVTRFLKILPRLRAEATQNPDQDSGGPEPEFDTQLVTIPANTNYQDPLHTLLHYLSTQSPECDMALVHDDDLMCIDGATLESLQPEVVIGYLQASRPKIYQVECDWLPSSSSETQKVKVAMLSKYTFENTAYYLVSDMERLGLSTSSSLPSKRPSSDPRSLLNSPRDRATRLLTRIVSKAPSFKRRLRRRDYISPPAATIEVLPDPILLKIFEFCLLGHERISGARAKTWNRLVHVCKRWRFIVFYSAMRLDLRLFCTDSTPVKETLNVWPPFPIEIRSNHVELGDNIIDVLVHPNRIREISLHGIRIPLERLTSAMQMPFPALERLSLSLDADGERAPVLPQTFLGESAPPLREFTLHRISFPTLPRLLSCSSDLSELHLHDIPPTGYIPPEEMVTCASALTKLKSLTIGFQLPTPNRTTSTPLPQRRAVFSSLTHFQFRGFTRYLGNLVARFDAPVLEVIKITLFDKPFSDSNWQQLPQFISSSPIPKSCNQAEIVFTRGSVKIKLLKASVARLSLSILYPRAGRVRSMAQICCDFRPLLVDVDLLDFQDEGFHEESIPFAWQAIFRAFQTVHTLCISPGLRSPILSALEGLDAESPIAFPALRDLYLWGYEPFESKHQVDAFTTERLRSNRPVAVHSWQGMTKPSLDSTPTATSSSHHPPAVPSPTRLIKGKKGLHEQYLF